MQRYRKVLFMFSTVFILSVANVLGQRTPVKTDSSVLTGVSFPEEALQDKRILSTAAAKTVLEMETSNFKIGISDVEVYSFPSSNGDIKDMQALADRLLKSMKNAGYVCIPSNSDPSIMWLGLNDKKIIMYLKANKKQTDITENGEMRY